MAETHTNVLVRMPNELKAEIQRESVLHGRTLTSEINIRLQDSLKREAITPAAAAPAALMAQNETGDYKVPVEVSATDRAMLQVFRALPPEKQLALLSLFK